MIENYRHDTDSNRTVLKETDARFLEAFISEKIKISSMIKKISGCFRGPYEMISILQCFYKIIPFSLFC